MANTQRLPGGIIPPVPTFFDAAGELDIPTLERHITWLSEQHIAGVLVLGSNGEAMHLDDDERKHVITAARDTLDSPSLRPWRERPILLAGTADQSTRGTIRRCRVAADVGAEIAVVLPPYAFPTQMNAAALEAHFVAVADASPIPILLYNMPANTANIDMSAELIIRLAQHPQIIGMKDSSGNITKMATIIAAVPPDFAVLAGSGGFLLPTLVVGGTGAIAAVANIFPSPLASIYLLWNQRFEEGVDTQMLEKQAYATQQQIIPINQLVTATFGVAGLKAALEIERGYGGAPRLPLLPLNEDNRVIVKKALHDFNAMLYNPILGERYILKK